MKNMGMIDRGGRLLIATLLAYLALGAGMLDGALYWVALAVAGIFAVTAVIGTCPLYRIFGLKTCRDS